MSERSLTRWNTAAFVLYALLLPLAVMEFMIAALAFGMATDGCHDAACDATYHEEPAILTVAIGVVVVLLSTGAGMIYGATRGKNMVAVPFIALLALFAVFWLGSAVLH
jgi:hypothetical protein